VITLSLYEQLKVRKEREELTLDHLTEGVLEKLYWDENLLVRDIADLFGIKMKQVQYRISKYGLQLNNKIGMGMTSALSGAIAEAAATMEQKIRREVYEEMDGKAVQLYRLKPRQDLRFIYPNLMDERFRIIGQHILISNELESDVLEIESLGPAIKGDYLYVRERDVQKLKDKGE
jgi:hypothetical protein